MRGLGFLAGAAAIIGCAAISTAAAKSPETAKKSRGAQLYDTIGCAACHGYVGQGGNSGPRVAMKPYSLEAFSRQLRRPRDMPPYSDKVLSDADVAALHAYVLQFK